MTEQHNCPICQKQLERINKIKYIDYQCAGEEHYYGKRIKDSVLTAVKIRFKESDGSKLYIKFYYDTNVTEVWSKKPLDQTDQYSKQNRIPIDRTFVPDFTDLDKIKQKIKTYLLFS